MPIVYDSTPKWVRGLAAAGATARGIVDDRRAGAEAKQRDLLRERADARADEEHQARQEKYKADAEEMKARNAERQEERAREAAARRARTQFDLWRMDVLRGRGVGSKVSDSMRKNSPLAAMALTGAALGAQNAQLQQALSTMDERGRQEAMAFLQERATARANQRASGRLVAEIQDAVAPANGGEPWLDEATAQQMIADLQDENRPDVNPRIVEAVLMREREAFARSRAARMSYQGAAQQARSYIDQPVPPEFLDITPREWSARRKQAEIIFGEWATGWQRVDPDDALSQIREVMFSPSGVASQYKVRQEVLAMASKDPGFLLLDPTEQEETLNRMASWVMSGGQPAQGAPEPAPLQTSQDAPQEEPVESSLAAAVKGSPTAAAAKARVRAILEARGLTDPNDPEVQRLLALVRESMGQRGADKAGEVRTLGGRGVQMSPAERRGQQPTPPSTSIIGVTEAQMGAPSPKPPVRKQRKAGGGTADR